MLNRILIVDDERSIADTLSMIFRFAGYETFTAYNGALGLEAARELAPKLVLSDVVMPELDGVTMAMRIRESMPQVAVLLFSGQAGTLDLLRAAEEKGFHFELLEKPMQPAEIIRKVGVMLSRAEPPRSVRKGSEFAERAQPSAASNPERQANRQSLAWRARMGAPAGRALDSRRRAMSDERTEGKRERPQISGDKVEHGGPGHEPEERRPRSKGEAADELRRRRERALDKTLADSFPTSDPPSSIPDPGEEDPYAA